MRMILIDNRTHHVLADTAETAENFAGSTVEAAGLIDRRRYEPVDHLVPDVDGVLVYTSPVEGPDAVPVVNRECLDTIAEIMGQCQFVGFLQVNPPGSSIPQPQRAISQCWRPAG